MPRTKMTIVVGTAATAIEAANSVLEELMSEISDWKTGMEGTNLESTAKYAALEECESALDEAASTTGSADAGDHGDLVCEWGEEQPDRRGRLARHRRAANAAAALEAAAGALEEAAGTLESEADDLETDADNFEAEAEEIESDLEDTPAESGEGEMPVPAESKAAEFPPEKRMADLRGQAEANREAAEAKRSEAEEMNDLASELNEAAQQVQGIEFPGMFG